MFCTFCTTFLALHHKENVLKMMDFLVFIAWYFTASIGCVKIVAPPTCAMNKQDLIVRISNDFYSYSSGEEPTTIQCNQRGPITFIQTDKPIYKPGQTGQ